MALASVISLALLLSPVLSQAMAVDTCEDDDGGCDEMGLVQLRTMARHDGKELAGADEDPWSSPPYVSAKLGKTRGCVNAGFGVLSQVIAFGHHPSWHTAGSALEAVGTLASFGLPPPFGIVVGGVLGTIGALFGLGGGSSGPSNADIIKQMNKGFAQLNQNQRRLENGQKIIMDKEKLIICNQGKIEQSIAQIAEEQNVTLDALSYMQTTLEHNFKEIQEELKDIEEAIFMQNLNALKANLRNVTATYKMAQILLRSCKLDPSKKAYFNQLRDYLQENFASGASQSFSLLGPAAVRPILQSVYKHMNRCAALHLYFSIATARMARFWLSFMNEIFHSTDITASTLTKELVTDFHGYNNVLGNLSTGMMSFIDQNYTGPELMQGSDFPHKLAWVDRPLSDVVDSLLLKLTEDPSYSSSVKAKLSKLKEVPSSDVKFLRSMFAEKLASSEYWTQGWADWPPSAFNHNSSPDWRLGIYSLIQNDTRQCERAVEWVDSLIGGNWSSSIKEFQPGDLALPRASSCALGFWNITSDDASIGFWNFVVGEFGFLLEEVSLDSAFYIVTGGGLAPVASLCYEE